MKGLASRSEIWTEQEIEFLEKNYEKMGFDEQAYPKRVVEVPMSA